MSKATVYVAARAGGRPSKDVVKNATDHFISTGSATANAEVLPILMNLCFEKRMDFTVRRGAGGDGYWVIQRA